MILLSFFVIKNVNFQNQGNLLNKTQSYFFDKNTLNVTGSNIDIDKVIIESIESGNVIFKKGNKVSKINNEYGETNFNIFYDNTLIGQAGIFKTNWWHIHDYYFKIIKTDTNIFFNFNVKGPDEKSLYYKCFEVDNANNKTTEIFYNLKGHTNQKNIKYYDEKKNVIVEELWEKNILISINIYTKGIWEKNYSINKHSEKEKYSLTKITQSDSLVYIYQTFVNEKSKKERITIKK